jgi:IS5 family transposase
MKRKKSSRPPAVATPLKDLLNPEHPLYRLAAVIDWQRFEAEFGKLYAEGLGRPALPTRLLVGLHYLKHLSQVSDEAAVASWVENPYWQYFCGEQYFQHRLPCDPSSLVRWRQRVGADGVEKLLQETLEAAQRTQALKPAEIKRVNVDTTVQEKAIAFPTDARLYHKARRALVRLSRQLNFRLRQSYERVGKRALSAAGALRRGAAVATGAPRDQETAGLSRASAAQSGEILRAVA